jgi:hypothetical protein
MTSSVPQAPHILKRPEGIVKSIIKKAASSPHQTASPWRLGFQHTNEDWGKKKI